MVPPVGYLKDTLRPLVNTNGTKRLPRRLYYMMPMTASLLALSIGSFTSGYLRVTCGRIVGLLVGLSVFFLICILCMLSSVLIGSIDNLKVTNRQYLLVSL